MKEKIASLLRAAFGEATSVELSIPEEPGFGHYSTNVAMRLAHARGKKPIELAGELADEIVKKSPKGFFEKVEAVAPGFINFWLSKETIADEFARIAREKHFGKSEIGKKKTIIVEYSSVNIAKAMNVGHFRTTIIGDALANIFETLGYKVVRWNYLGDWGTQFGKLIVAYKLWGKKEDIEKHPIEELQ